MKNKSQNKINECFRFFFLALIVFFIHHPSSVAQDVQYKSKDIAVTRQQTNEFDEATLRKKMKDDGLLDPVIDKLIEQRKTWVKQGKNIYWSNVKTSKPPITHAPCGDMGAENGWGQWSADIGTANSGSQTWTPPAGAPGAPNFNLTSGAGIDPNTPGPNAGDPTIPVVCPGFGSASIQIGEPCQAGCVAEQLTYPLTVTPQDSNFVYAYAIVIEDAGHSPSDQPFVQFSVLDQNGNLVPQCANFIYTGGPSIPGFYDVSGTGCGWAGTDQYKPWTIVGIDLSNYVGQTVTIVITNVDCAQCGHWAYSYWDFMCGTASLSAGCIGNQASICGPIDPNINYTYQWYQNGVAIPPPQGTSQCITVTAQPGDTFSVDVMQPSGCNFFLGYVPASVIPDFSYTGNCGTFTFQDSSFVSPASVTMTNWNWSFPGGTPSTATTPTVSVTYNTPGTYVVSYTVTCSAGCSAVATNTITVTGLPTAQFVPSPACLGNAVSFTDASISPAGDPIVSWNWSMSPGIPASATGTNASTTYSTSGPQTVTLTVTTQSGCVSSASIPVDVYAPPVALFSGNIQGCAPQCGGYTDASTSVDGAITNWEWTFPGGTPSSSIAQNPNPVCYNTAGAYGATLIVTSSYGCKDTLTQGPLVNVYPWPNANFCIDPAQAPITDPTFVFCDLWSSDVSQWNWNFGDGDSDQVSTDPVHSYTAMITENDFYYFNVSLYVQNNYGCWDTISYPVEILPEFTFYIPNSFTPNDDKNNTLFFGKGRGIKQYTIEIFDRWGNLQWDCEFTGKNTDWDDAGKDGMPAACKWDGKNEGGGGDIGGRSGTLAQEDVYVWKVNLTDVFDKKHRYVGHVSVVR